MLSPARVLLLQAIAASGSVSGAARRLGYSASGVSQQLAALERDVGAPVFERHARGVRPTDVGAVLLEHAAVVAAQLQAARGEVLEVLRADRGVVRIGSLASATAALVAPAAAAFLSDRPGVRLLLRELEPAQSLPLVAARELDVALAFDYPALAVAVPPQVQVEQLCEDPLVVALPAGDPAAAHAAASLEDLREHAWVHGHDWGPPTRLLHRLCEEAGFSPRAVYESDSYDVQLTLVAAGLGVALVPLMALGSGRPGVTVRTLAHPAATRRVTVVTAAGRVGPAASQLVRHLRAAAADRPTRPPRSVAPGD